MLVKTALMSGTTLLKARRINVTLLKLTKCQYDALFKEGWDWSWLPATRQLCFNGIPVLVYGYHVEPISSYGAELIPDTEQSVSHA